MKQRDRHSGKSRKSRKPKYGILSCAAYMYRMLWKYERGLAWTGALLVPWNLAMAALGLYTPVVTLRYLENSDRFSRVALVILGLLGAELLFSLAGDILKNKKGTSEMYIVSRMKYELKKVHLERDYYF